MKFLIWLGKVILMFGILAAAAIGWIFILLSQGDGLFGSGPSQGVLILDYIFLFATAVLYIFLCVKISRLGTEKPEKTDSFLKKAKQPLLIIVPVILIVVGFALIDPAEQLITEIRAKNAVRTADEIIEYQNDHDTMGGTILNTGLKRDSIAIDYGRKTVSFIFDGGYEQIKKYRLEKGDISDKQSSLQYIANLSSPGKTFSTYCYGEKPHLTTGLRLEMGDGSVYSAEFETEYFAINAYPWINIMNAQENSDIVLNYGTNSIKENYFGIESNTLFIDSETKTVSVVSGDDRHISCDSFELVPVEGPAKIEDIYLQAKIDLDIGTLYTYTGRNYPDEWEKKRTDGMVLITKDGGIFADDDESNSHGVWGYWDFYHSEYKCIEDHVNITSSGIENYIERKE